MSTLSFQHFGRTIVQRELPTTDGATSGFTSDGGFYARPYTGAPVAVETTDAQSEPVRERATVDSQSQRTSPMYGLSETTAADNRRWEIIAKGRADIAAAEARQRGTRDVSIAEINRRARAHYRTGDALLTNVTPAETNAYARTTARVDSGKIWSGGEASMLNQLQNLSADKRAAAFDELARGADPQSVAERYLGSGTAWRTAANGTVYSASNEVGARNEQGTPGGTQDASLRHWDAARQRDTSLIRRMQRANERSR